MKDPFDGNYPSLPRDCHSRAHACSQGWRVPDQARNAHVKSLREEVKKWEWRESSGVEDSAERD